MRTPRIFSVVFVVPVVALFLAATPVLAGWGECSGSKMTSSECSGTKMTSSECSSEKSIVDVAVSAGSFKTLVAAVKAAGLVEALEGKGPYTVFAPTDEAFAKLPKGTVEALLKERRKNESPVARFHHFDFPL